MKRALISSESSSQAVAFICTRMTVHDEEDIEEMKELAKEGSGLTRFINEVQPGYAKRER